MINKYLSCRPFHTAVFDVLDTESQVAYRAQYNTRFFSSTFRKASRKTAKSGIVFIFLPLLYFTFRHPPPPSPILRPFSKP